MADSSLKSGLSGRLTGLGTGSSEVCRMGLLAEKKVWTVDSLLGVGCNTFLVPPKSLVQQLTNIFFVVKSNGISWFLRGYPKYAMNDENSIPIHSTDIIENG